MMQQTNALPVGAILEEYRIESVLGTGGFGITYKAWDGNLESWVAIKEYFPSEWSYRDHDGLTVRANAPGMQSVADPNVPDYEWGLDRFLDEARVLARVRSPYVVRINRYFRANGSAYIVMDYEDGEPLSAVLRRRTTLDEQDIFGMLDQILPALQAVHEQGFLHRDIKPGNLYVRADGSVILIDFGAARQSLGRQSKSVTGLVTPGYSPPEQYALRSDRYGTWTDIYALGAVLYRCISGQPPVESAERLIEDSMIPAVQVGADRYRMELLKVIDKALAVRPEHRYQNVEEVRVELGMQGPESGDGSEQPPSTVVSGPRVEEAETRFHSESAERQSAPAQESESRGIPAAVFGVAAGLSAVVVAAGIWWWMAGIGTGDSPALTETPSALEGREQGPEFSDRGFWRYLDYLVDHNQSFAAQQTFWLESLGDGSSAIRGASTEGTSAPGEEQQRIHELLNLAAQRFRDNQLTIPAENNALYFYEQVLALDPDNPQALAGRSNIVDRYAALASKELNSADYAGARQMVRRGLTITPDHPGLLALSAKLAQGPSVRRQSSPTRRVIRVYPERPTVTPAELFNRDSR